MTSQGVEATRGARLAGAALALCLPWALGVLPVALGSGPAGLAWALPGTAVALVLPLDSPPFAALVTVALGATALGIACVFALTAHSTRWLAPVAGVSLVLGVLFGQALGA
ncbi:MAG: hypothetical protein AAFP86_07280 [Planctomycetota bacterium]